MIVFIIRSSCYDLKNAFLLSLKVKNIIHNYEVIIIAASFDISDQIFLIMSIIMTPTAQELKSVY